MSADGESVLLAKRQGEADYDGTYTFVGGKMEATDASILAGMKREKDEEIGQDAKVRVLADETKNVLFRKKDGNAMILPHIAAQFVSGKIQLNDDEYSGYKWVPIKELDNFEPKVPNIPEMAVWAAAKLSSANSDQLAEI